MTTKQNEEDKKPKNPSFPIKDKKNINNFNKGKGFGKSSFRNPNMSNKRGNR